MLLGRRSTAFSLSAPLKKVCFVSFLSNDVNIASPKRNPLVKKEIEWTDRMVSDFRKYEDDVKWVFPDCSLYNLTTVAVSSLSTSLFNPFFKPVKKKL